MLKSRLIPIALLILGLWLLAGCFYLPFPEHPTNGQKDFRKVVGDANSKKPLRIGKATLEQVIAVLGEPPYATRDRKSVAYAAEFEGGLWVYPICFSAAPDTARIYAIRLDFDSQGVLEGFEIGQKDEPRYFMNTVIPQPPYGVVESIQRPGEPLVPALWPTGSTKPASGSRK